MHQVAVCLSHEQKICQRQLRQQVCSFHPQPKAAFHWFERSHYLIKQRARAWSLYSYLVSKTTNFYTDTIFHSAKFHACSWKGLLLDLIHNESQLGGAVSQQPQRERREIYTCSHTTLTVFKPRSATFTRIKSFLLSKTRSSKSVHSRAQHIASINYKTQHENLLAPPAAKVD